jgi:predicted nucleic acid-binding protein
MQKGSKLIISDTSCIILLLKIDELSLLKEVAGEVIITSIIKEELNIELPDWIKVKNPQNKKYLPLIEQEVDKGEASAIALMLEIDNALLLIDDLKGRKLAEKLHLEFSGTFGLILKAKQSGIISAIKPILIKIRLTNFRFSEKLFDDILKNANE